MLPRHYAAAVGVHLRPVGPLPAAVYWRRRAALLVGLLLLLVLLRACTGGSDGQDEQLSSAASAVAGTGSLPVTGGPTGGPPSSATPLPSASAPPSPSGPARSPSASPSPSALPNSNPSAVPNPSASPNSSGSPNSSPPPNPSGGAAGSPSPLAVRACEEDDLRVETRAASAVYQVGEPLGLALRIRNQSQQACTLPGRRGWELRVLSGPDRIWSSADCGSVGPGRTEPLAPKQTEVMEMAWNGRRSRPGCKGPGERAQPGTYRLVARVGTLVVPGEVFDVVR